MTTTTKLLGCALLIAGLGPLSASCSKDEVEAAGDKAGQMAEDAKAKAGVLKDQFGAWLADSEAALDQKLAELQASEAANDVTGASEQAVEALERRVADAKAMLAGWKDVSADKWAEWSAKARDTVSKLKADLQKAIDG